MTISLYVNTSEKEKLDKSLSNKTDLNGYLKQGSSVVNPIITIQITNPSKYNYVYIPQFNRYYFITDTVNVRNNIWEIHMHVDSLSSFKSEIRANKAIIESIEKILISATPDLVPAQSLAAYRSLPSLLLPPKALSADVHIRPYSLPAEPAPR